MKKQPISKQEQYNKLHAENRMKRRQEELARRAAEKAKRDELYFRRRVKNASSKKVPFTLRTRSYYRFAKEYPSNVDTNGFRENKPPVKKLTPVKKIILFLVCIVVFAAALIGAKTGLVISMREPENISTGDPIAVSQPLRAYHFAVNEINDITTIKNILEVNDCNAAVFEFKNEDGKLNFGALPPTRTAEPGTELTTEIQEETTAAPVTEYDKKWDIIKELESEGVKTVAYISCYKDSAKAVSDPSLAVEDYDSPGTALKDSKGNMWLDPFSPGVTEYLVELMQKAMDGGFSYVLLDNVCRPVNMGLKTAYYPFAGDTGSDFNGALSRFIQAAVNGIGREKVIVMSDPYGFISAKDDVSGRYGGNISDSGAGNYAIDARLSHMQTKGFDPAEIYTYVKEMPLVAVIDSFSLSVDAARDSETPTDAKLWACLEYGEDKATADKILNGSKTDNYILW